MFKPIDVRRRIRFAFLLAIPLVSTAAFARGIDCPDLRFTCALGDTFEIESHFAFPSHCETNGSVKQAAGRYCDTQGCHGALERANGCSVPVPGVKDFYNTAFQAACDLHDICYDTIGTTQEKCDSQFYDNLLALCGLPGIGKNFYTACLVNAKAMWLAVSTAAKANFTDGQKWASVNCTEADVPPLPAPLVDRLVRLRPKASTDPVLCIDAGRIDDGMPAHLCPDAGTPSQRWTIHQETLGYYSLKVDLSEKCLDVKDGSRADGGALQQWVCSTFDNPNQRWSILLDGRDGWVLRAKVSGKCLQYNMSSQTVEQRACTGGDEQRWFLEDDIEEEAPPLFQYLQIVGKASGKSIAIEGAKTDNGAATVLAPKANTPSQLWKIGTDPSGYYYLRVKHSDKCLDLDRAGTVEGTRVQQSDCQEVDKQLWNFEKTGSGWLITSKVSGFCLDAKGLSKEDGTQVYSWPCTGADNEIWELKTVP